MAPTFRKILVPTDFSPAGDAAVPVAFSMAAASGASVILVHVLEGLSTPTPLYAHYHPMPGPDEVRKMEAKAREGLAALVPAEHRQVAHSIVVGRGSAQDELPRLAEEHGADLVVISTHGYKGVKRFFLGSVAERVSRDAPCAVLLLRG